MVRPWAEVRLAGGRAGPRWVTEDEAIALQIRGNRNEEFGDTPTGGENVVQVRLKTK